MSLSILSNLIFILAIGEIQVAVINKPNNELFPLSIIHLNDFHARFVETNWQSTTCKQKIGQVCIGGYARTLTVIKQLLKEKADKNPIYLNIGDNFFGTLWYYLLGWNVTSTFLNYLPADATTLGNHEFDSGIEGVVPFMENMISPVVVANFDDTDEPTFQGKYKKSIVIERSGRKIGLIGVTVRSTQFTGLAGKLIFLDEVKSVKNEADRLKQEENVDIIIVLSHCGLKLDRKMAVEGGTNIDVIVGGHSHDLLFTGLVVPGPDKPADIYPILVNQSDHHTVLIVQASAFSKYVGNLTVYFDDNGNVQNWEGNPVYLDSKFPEDPTIVKELEPWKDEVEKIGLRNVGTIQDSMDQSVCVHEECPLGNLITDSFVDYFVNHPDYQENDGCPYVSIAMTLSGGIVSNLNAGEVTYDDLFMVLPFHYTIDTLELLGSDLKEVLELSGAVHKYRSFLQFSGIKVIYNVTNPIGSRVVSAKILCRECKILRYEPLELKKWYRLVVPYLLGQGVFGFSPFQNRRNYRKGDAKEIDAVDLYLAKNSPYVPKKSDRITIFT